MAGAYIVPAASTGTGTTLRRYYQLLAEQLGTYAEYTVSTTASTGEAGRLVLIDELRDDEEAREYWGGGYCYALSGAQAQAQRRVLKDGYEGPVGGLVLSRPFAAALASGSSVAMSEPLPVREYIGVKGLVDIVNEALARIWVEAWLTITGSGDHDYDLAAYPWLTRMDQTRGIYDTRGLSSTLPAQLVRDGYEIRRNGVTRTLVTNALYSTTETFNLAVVARGDRLIYGGSSWGYATTPGLVNDTDQALAAEENVVALGMVKACQELAKMVRKRRDLSPAEKAAQIDEITLKKRPWLPAAYDAVMLEGPGPMQEYTAALVGGEASTVDTYPPPALSVPLV